MPRHISRHLADPVKGTALEGLDVNDGTGSRIALDRVYRVANGRRVRFENDLK